MLFRSRHERFALYTSIASRAHSIEVWGPENKGVFAGLFRRFPQTQEEVEWIWYRRQKIRLGLCKSIHHGIVNTSTTPYTNQTMGIIYGPEEVTEWKVENCFDLWHHRIYWSHAGWDPFLAQALPRWR